MNRSKSIPLAIRRTLRVGNRLAGRCSAFYGASVPAGNHPPKFTGNPAKFVEFMSYLVDLNQYFWFNIVTP